MRTDTADLAAHPAGRASTHSIVVAACESLAETEAMARWILPVLEAWPAAAWQMFLADAGNCNDVKAARYETAEAALDWQTVDHESGGPEDPVCRIIGGRAGIVIHAHHVIANEAGRGLEGLVAAITSFPANDPLARPLKRSFASFGVTAGI